MKIESERSCSGYRTQFIQDPKEKREAWTAIADVIGDGPYLGVMRLIMQEPLYFDDMMRGMTASDMIMHALDSGELFVHFGVEGNKRYLVGVTILRNIIHEREATFEAWVTPQFRGHYCVKTAALHVFEYAFKPFPRGLGLKKIKAQIATSNAHAINAAAKLGFFHIGTSPLDGLFNGVPVDMLYCELLNPTCFNLGVTNGRQKESSSTDLLPASDTGLHAAGAVQPAASVQPASAVRSTARSARGGSAGVESRADNIPGKPDRRVRSGKRSAGVSTVKPKSKRSRANS